MVEYRATQKDISIDYLTGKTLITYMVERADRDALDSCRDKELRLTVKEWRDKRSLNANGYYWSLVGQIAKLHRLTETEVHNIYLMILGIPELFDGQKVYSVLPDTDETEKKVLGTSTYHLKPTSEVRVGRDGKAYRTYFMLNGSHEFDTEEFSRLLDCIIEDCKAEGIPTETPDEKARMMELYKAEYERKNHESFNSL